MMRTIYDTQTPKWLRAAEKYFGWLAVPNIAILLVTLQGLGFLFVMSDPAWLERLALLPQRVLEGEVWRLLTFLALPLSMSPFFLFFVLWFLYFILSSIEQQWGAFRTTLYVLVSIVLTTAYSFAFDYPVWRVSHFESTLFLAAAALYPEMEVRLFFALPVKFKWMAWLTVFFVLVEMARGSWLDRGYLLAIYSNYILFFGPATLARLRQLQRNRRFRQKMR